MKSLTILPTPPSVTLYGWTECSVARASDRLTLAPFEWVCPNVVGPVCRSCSQLFQRIWRSKLFVFGIPFGWSTKDSTLWRLHLRFRACKSNTLLFCILVALLIDLQRTYGPWWKLCPSARRKLKKASDTFISEDFVGMVTLPPSWA